MAKSATYICANDECGKPFVARTYEREKGWARYCSKSCAAQVQHRTMVAQSSNGQTAQTLDAAWRGIANSPQTHQDDAGDVQSKE